MIKAHRTIPGILLALSASLSGCSKDDGVDYCKNHYAFHEEHIGSVANLSIETTDSGDLNGNLTIPATALGELTESDIDELFSSADDIVTVESEFPCTMSFGTVNQDDGLLAVSFYANCGADNKLDRIGIGILDHVAQLEEVVASVKTPATSKRFGISRQCDAPIFRLD